MLSLIGAGCSNVHSIVGNSTVATREKAVNIAGAVGT
jgi:hypothetical protein